MKFYHPEQCYIELPPALGSSNRIRGLHLLEHSFKLTVFKTQLLDLNTTQSNLNERPTDKSKCKVLVIDVISVWRHHVERHPEHYYYLNNSSVLTLDGIIKFLAQLNESPREALRQCRNFNSTSDSGSRDSNFNYQLSGIVIDNISYLVQRSKNVGNANDTQKSLMLLLRCLNMVSRNFGCWYITISYGLEYYSGIEMSFRTVSTVSGTKSYPTLVPMNFLNEMDAVILRETEYGARRLK